MLRHSQERTSRRNSITENLVSDAKTLKEKHLKSDASFCLNRGYSIFILLVLMTLSFCAGYIKKAAENSEEATDTSWKSLRKIEVLEHMQGYSNAYPTYDESPSGENENSASDESIEELINESEIELAREQEEIKILTTSTEESELYSNYDDLKIAPWVTVPNIANNYNLPFKLPKRNLWWNVKLYENHYRKHPIKKLIPRLRSNIQLTVDEFHTRFRKPAQPVVFNFENLRDLGFPTRSYTIEELKLMFPYDEATVTSKVQADFVANGIRKAEEELDIGPGLAAIERDEQLSKKGKLRSFPRNLKVRPSAIDKLNVKRPPLLKEDDDSQWQLPTLWMGTSSSDTRFHHDCCDNFVMMISGTKRFSLAPTSDWRILNPDCVGKNKALCWANVNNPNTEVPGINKKAAEASLKYLNKMIVDVGPGDILYMPAGWFHHIENLGPTVMVNWWTKGTETCALARSVKSPDSY